MIVKDKKILRVESFDRRPLNSGGFDSLEPFSLDFWGQPKKAGYQVDLVPYINGISGEKDPMIRPLDHPARFIHLSTIYERHSCPKNIVFKTENGETFGLGEIIGRLWN